MYGVAAEKHDKGIAMSRNQNTPLIRMKKLREMTGLCPSSIYLRLDPNSKYFDPTFPKSVCLSVTGKGAVAWVLPEVEAWIESKIANRH